MRDVGKTGVKLSAVTLGTWGLTEPVYAGHDPTALTPLVQRAIDLGVRTFDLAPLWGDGAAEQNVGAAVGARRDLVRYVTRAGVVRSGSTVVRRYDVASLLADLDGSLTRLGTDHVDVWLLHDPPVDVLAQDDWLEAIRKARDSGKIRAWGASVGDVERARMAMAKGAQALCLVYNLAESDDVHDLGAELSLAHVAVLARATMGYGSLSGTWHEHMRFPESDHRARRFDAAAMRTRVQLVSRMRFLVHDEVRSMAEASLRFVLANQLVTTAVVGARTMAQLEEAARVGAAREPYLPASDLTRIGQVIAASMRG